MNIETAEPVISRLLGAVEYCVATIIWMRVMA